MAMNSTGSAALCYFDGPNWLLFSENVAPLVYYSHLPVMLIAAALSVFMLWQGRRQLPNQILSVLTLTFAVWVFLDSIFWASNRSDVIMFVWAAIVVIEPLVHIAALYLLYLLVEERDMPYGAKAFLFALYLPLILFGPSIYNLAAFDIGSCLADEGFIARYYSYGLEIFAMLMVILYAISRYRIAPSSEHKWKIIMLSTGTFLLMFAFSWGNIIGSFTDEWEIAQYGLFGMPVFIAFLLYTIVRYKLFNIKLVGAVALVLVLCALNFALLFVDDVVSFRSVAIATLSISLIFGLILIRSVNREVAQRELIEIQERELELVNQQQENLLHFISHEIKGFLTEGQNAFAGIVEGDYGDASPQLMALARTALEKMRAGVDTVMNILDASNLKKGTVSYKKEKYDFRDVVEKSMDVMVLRAQAKNLAIDWTVDGNSSYTAVGDKEKIQEHVVRNLIDNAIRYTPKGSIHVSLTRASKNIRFSVKDTGVGITEEDKARLFTEGGHGKDSIKVNVDSTGYGLFIAKQVTEAHGGTIRAESEGAGKGSEFVVMMPLG